ncbi:MAG: competence protein ComEA [Candidatus Atribacteria bacterium]|nr:competence protein ComEA [Candidatus Atribacteria bacterium]
MDFSRQERLALLLISLVTALGLGFIAGKNFYPPKVSDNAEKTLLVIQVDGAVNSPGIYQVTPGTRIFEALELAGGTREDAQTESLNLALPVYDGQRISIPSSLFLSSPEGKTTVSQVQPALQLINVNTASQKELESLPGIGEVIAQRIIEYREQNGSFSRPEDLLKVKGIGEKKLEAIKTLITF